MTTDAGRLDDGEPPDPRPHRPGRNWHIRRPLEPKSWLVSLGFNCMIGGFLTGGLLMVPAILLAVAELARCAVRRERPHIHVYWTLWISLVPALGILGLMLGPVVRG